MLPSQMLKGILDCCILLVIQKNETYGYDISLQLQKYGFSDISEGTIYPLLLRLEKNEWIHANYRDSILGPKRKYFSITEKGKHEIDNFLENWSSLKLAVDQLVEGEHDE